MPDIDTEKMRLLRTWTEDFGGTGSDQYTVFQDPADRSRFVVRRSGVAYGWDQEECEELRAPDKKTREAWEANPRHVRYARQEVPHPDPWSVVPGLEWQHEKRFQNILLEVRRSRLYRSSPLEFMVESWDAKQPEPSYSCRFLSLKTADEAAELLADPKAFLERRG